MIKEVDVDGDGRIDFYGKRVAVVSGLLYCRKKNNNYNTRREGIHFIFNLTYGVLKNHEYTMINVLKKNHHNSLSLVLSKREIQAGRGIRVVPRCFTISQSIKYLLKRN